MCHNLDVNRLASTAMQALTPFALLAYCTSSVFGWVGQLHAGADGVLLLDEVTYAS